MAVSESKELFGASTAFTITLASLASSTAGVGRQSAIIDNTTTRFRDYLIYILLTQGTTPTSSRGAYIYLIRDDINATPHRSDAAGASDAGITILNAPLIGVLQNKAAASSNDPLYGEFLVERVGPKFGIAIVHDTVAALHATAGNHWARYLGLNSENQ